MGPRPTPRAAQLREALGKTIDQIWGASESDSNFAANNFAEAISEHAGPGKVLAALQPSTDEQKRTLAAATSTADALAQARTQMSFALTAPVSYPLLLTVVGWVACLFCGFGLTSRATVTSVIALAVGSVAVASAVLLISGAFLPRFRGVSRFVGAVGAGAGGDGQGVTQLDLF